MGQIRQEWPRVQIVIRADSGFCRDEILSWCEAQHRVDYVIGLAKNKRLLRAIETPMEKAKQRFDRTGKSARVFKTFQYRTLDSWTRERRVIGKAEHLAKGANPRFIVTSLPKGQPTPKQIYEQIYCARGDMEKPDQRATARIVCRPDQHGHHARQSTPALLLIGRVHVDASLATARIAGYRIRACAVHHDPPQVAQDRSADPRHRPAGSGFGWPAGIPMPTCLLRSTRTSRKSRYVVKRLRSDIPPVSTLVGIAVSVIPLSPCHSLQHQSLRLRFSAQLASLLPRHRSRPLSLLPIARFAIILEKCGLGHPVKWQTSDSRNLGRRIPLWESYDRST